MEMIKCRCNPFQQILHVTRIQKIYTLTYLGRTVFEDKMLQTHAILQSMRSVLTSAPDKQQDTSSDTPTLDIPTESADTPTPQQQESEVVNKAVNQNQTKNQANRSFNHAGVNGRASQVRGGNR